MSKIVENVSAMIAETISEFVVHQPDLLEVCCDLGDVAVVLLHYAHDVPNEAHWLDWRKSGFPHVRLECTWHKQPGVPREIHLSLESDAGCLCQQYTSQVDVESN